MKRSTLVITLAAIFLVGLTASATAYLVQREDVKPPAKVATAPASAPQPQQVACDDGNIVGKVLGGVGGGAAGSMVGKGTGKTAATIGGTLGGAYIGGEVIPTRNVTCR